MSEFQELLAFPPAPGLDIYGKLDPKKFKPDSPEMRGQKLFFGKAQCSVCHPAPYYTDNLMHDLKVERFYKPQMINGLMRRRRDRSRRSRCAASRNRRPTSTTAGC